MKKNFKKLIALILCIIAGFSAIMVAEAATAPKTLKATHYVSKNNPPIKFPATYRIMKTTTGEYIYCVYYAKQAPIESLTYTNAVAEYPVLRPLISFNKDEIINIAKEINTYETSILPYEDCCTVFLPKFPIIKPKIKEAEIEESKIELNELINFVVNNIEVIDLDKI